MTSETRSQIAHEFHQRALTAQARARALKRALVFAEFCLLVVVAVCVVMALKGAA